jgi:hypothetical protein
LLIRLVDGATVKCRVVSASRSKIVIELDGYHRHMTPAAHLPGGPRRFPGFEWVLGKPAVKLG